MTYTTKRVAVIGAGVSGVTSAKHLKAAGVEVVVYERSSKCGGNWAYDERRPRDATYPSLVPSQADVVPEFQVERSEDRRVGEGRNGGKSHAPDDDDVELKFAPPGPAYSGLVNNISTALQELKGFPWPEGTNDFVNVRVKGDYIQAYAKHFEIEPLIRYNTRVEKLDKVGQKWKLQSSTLVKNPQGKFEKEEDIQEFDAVVVANGHYHACKVPDIPGLKEWKSKWPDRVQHSKRYRRPDEFKEENVLLIGAGVSATDIARETVPLAKKVYQSSRGSPYDIPLAFLPPGAERISEVASFSPPDSSSRPGPVTLKDGRVLHDIDQVILCTGYHFSHPFLPDLHEDDTLPQDASETVLVTDGTQMHNLHKDIFYIPDPTLSFVGVPFYTATFTCFEFQAIAVAAVLSGRAWLPRQEEMREEYRKRVETKGYGRAFHSLRDQQVAYANELLEWINGQAETTGAERVEGYSAKWIEEDGLKLQKMRRMWEVKEELRSGVEDSEAVKRIWGARLQGEVKV